MAFRNGPIENVHAGKRCPTCDGHPEYCHITDPEMKEIMKATVNMLATLLTIQETDPSLYAAQIVNAWDYVRLWETPKPVPQFLFKKTQCKMEDDLP
jgi:hypothetical protein